MIVSKPQQNIYVFVSGKQIATLAIDVLIYYICTSKIAHMDTKLTVRLDSNVIERAKVYSRNHNVSISRLIESYLDSVTKDKSKEIEITPLVKSLSGVVKISVDFDYKKEYGDYLIEKYK